MGKVAMVKDSVIGYLRGVRQEVSHVVWPTRAEVVRHTTAVILFSVGISLLLAGLDLGFRAGIDQLLKIK